MPDPDPEPKGDPFKSEWPAYEAPRPKPAEPGKPVDYFNEDLNNPRYEWDWLPAGVAYQSGGPNRHGAITVAAGKSFQFPGDVENGEVRATIERKSTGDDSGTYELRFRASGGNYSALQVRGDGYYRIVSVSGGKTNTLVGNSSGDYLPLPGWSRTSTRDEVLLVFRGSQVTGTFNGRRLNSTSEAPEGAGKVGIATTGVALSIEKLSVDE